MKKRRLKLSENRVLRGILGRRGEEVTVKWRKLHYDGLNDMCSSPNIFRMLKWRRREWMGLVACIGERRVV